MKAQQLSFENEATERSKISHLLLILLPLRNLFVAAGPIIKFEIWPSIWFTPFLVFPYITYAFAKFSLGRYGGPSLCFILLWNSIKDANYNHLIYDFLTLRHCNFCLTQLMQPSLKQQHVLQHAWHLKHKVRELFDLVTNYFFMFQLPQFLTSLVNYFARVKLPSQLLLNSPQFPILHLLFKIFSMIPMQRKKNCVRKVVGLDFCFFKVNFHLSKEVFLVLGIPWHHSHLALGTQQLGQQNYY